jgi:hypothetical protein
MPLGMLWKLQCFVKKESEEKGTKSAGTGKQNVGF